MENNSNMALAKKPEMQTLLLIQCSVNKDITEYISKEKHLTVDLAIKSTHIEDLVKMVGEKDILKAITGAILMAAEYFNVKGDMSDTQAVQTASLFMEQFPMETFEDLLICLKNAKIGKYGPVYNRIDGQMIFTWFRLYLDEKYERFEHLKRKEKIELQKETEDIFFDILKNALQERAQKRDRSQIIRITHESHFVQFSEALINFTKEELQESLDYYKKQETMTLHGQYQPYIDLLQNTIKGK